MRLFFKGSTLESTSNQTNAYFIIEIDLRKQSKFELEFENEKEKKNMISIFSKPERCN